MTLIESFDSAPLQNIAECLAIRPEKLILVGSQKQLDEGFARYEKLLEAWEIPTKAIPKAIDSASFDYVQKEFEQLIRENSPCAIDLFGGNEIHLVAAGAAYHKLKDSCQVSLQKMDTNTDS